MFATVDGLQIFYKRVDNNGQYLLILHGWGCSTETTDCIFSFLDKMGKSVIAIDFPGFGKSQTPPPSFTIYDYASITIKLLQSLGIDKVDVIAHSFGGRVAMLMAEEGKVNRLLITGGAGMRPRRTIGYYLKVFGYKIKKRLKLNVNQCGSDDYKKLDKNMRKVFVGVVNTHLEKHVKNIKIPTLLVWGKSDKETPLYMAKRIKRLVKDSEIILLNGGHFAFIENPIIFTNIAVAFFKEEV